MFRLRCGVAEQTGTLRLPSIFSLYPQNTHKKFIFKPKIRTRLNLSQHSNNYELNMELKTWNLSFKSFFLWKQRVFRSTKKNWLWNKEYIKLGWVEKSENFENGKQEIVYNIYIILISKKNSFHFKSKRNKTGILRIYSFRAFFHNNVDKYLEIIIKILIDENLT